MFERFSDAARTAVNGAQAVARSLGDRHIGTEHLLLSLLEGGDATADTLARHGLDPADLRARIARGDNAGGDPLDPEALRAIGIDLDAVREATEESFGEGALDVPAGRHRRSPTGHIPFMADAKKSLELSLRQALRLKSKRIDSGHVALGVLQDPRFRSTRLADAAGADLDALRADLVRQVTAKAA
ncbi:Clp protease N-terminal domain-containing protein [Actinomadura fibrosa]|uniref:Clp protease N-terminal domain-containing protein n=1 Tax=Actinomadura fibrosa TaxID=111802 RepID=A0ABW2XPW6_9ACTN|nr:Clp protease N-terminal domain-containing protein [Actinomadura fibrosa]